MLLATTTTFFYEESVDVVVCVWFELTTPKIDCEGRSLMVRSLRTLLFLRSEWSDNIFAMV